MKYAVLLSVLVLAGCAQAEAVKMKHADGRTVQCGPYRVGGFNGEAMATAQQESCLNDYRVQGFVRVPN
jgi:hypothetical protein